MRPDEKVQYLNALNRWDKHRVNPEFTIRSTCQGNKKTGEFSPVFNYYMK